MKAPGELTHLVDAFLVVEAPRQRLSHWTQALAALDSPLAPPLATVTAYYDPTTDHAILNLRYDELGLGPKRLEFVVEVALLAEVGMIQPAELSEGERRRFLTERLARCTLQIPHQRGVIGALTELVRRLRDQRTSSKPPPFPRGDTKDPVLLVGAKGTRNDLVKIAATKTTRDDVTKPERPSEKFSDAAGSPPPQASRNLIQRMSRAVTVAAPDSLDPKVLDAEAEALPPPPPRARARSPQFPQNDIELPSTIYARYLRSGKWVPIRIGSLSLKGAALMTGALPRLHDHVDVALSYGAHRALVRGEVGKVSTVREAAVTGASTFSVSFELDTASRRQLTALLTAARAARVTIKPPPARANRRLIVEWPICLGTMKGMMKGDALDVSTSGLFVRPAHPLTIDTTCNFSSVLDDGDGPIAGRAKIVRHLTDIEAQACGLAAGYGLSILDMGDLDRRRWDSFIHRIEKRADKRLLVGAAPSRLAELQGALAGAGYAVMGASDPGGLVTLANADARPVDAALVDAEWLADASSAAWVESLFSARHVPCVTVSGDARRARGMVDRMLDVVG